MIRFASALFLALPVLAAGCADPAPPAPDPASIDRLVASMASRQAETDVQAKVQKKLESADRFAGPLAKAQPEKIDPNVVAALVAR